MSPSDKLFSFHITLDRWGRLSPNSLLLVVVFKRTDSKHLAPMILMIIIDVLFSVSHQSSLSLSFSYIIWRVQFLHILHAHQSDQFNLFVYSFAVDAYTVFFKIYILKF